MGQGEKDNSLMLLRLLPKVPAGPEFTFRLTFDKCYAKTNNSSIQFFDYALINLNTATSNEICLLQKMQI